MKCLLCESATVHQIDSIPVDYLIDAYKKAFSEDFSYLFSCEEIKFCNCRNCGLLFYSPSITGDDKYYNAIQKNDWYYRTEKEEYRYASLHIKDNSSVLDIGCGDGSFSKYLPRACFTGLEISSDAVHNGRQNGIRILNESIEDHSIKNASGYDAVTMFQVLEHVSDVKGFLLSAISCLKPGGNLIVAVPNEDSYIRFRSNALLNMPPHHISRWTDKSLEKISKLTGLELCGIYHEPLDKAHIKEFLTTFFERCTRLDFTNRAKLVNRKISFRLRNWVAYKAACLCSAKSINNSFLPIGHTVVAIYKKPI